MYYEMELVVVNFESVLRKSFKEQGVIELVYITLTTADLLVLLILGADFYRFWRSSVRSSPLRAWWEEEG